MVEGLRRSIDRQPINAPSPLMVELSRRLGESTDKPRRWATL